MNRFDNRQQTRTVLLICLGLLFFCAPFSYLHAERLSFSQVVLDGHLVQGGLVIGKTTAGNQVLFNGQSVHVSPKGDFILGFHRDEPAQVSLQIRSPDHATVLDTTLKINKRQYRIQRINGLPPSKVTPRKPEVVARIKKEQQLARQARTLDDDRVDFLTEFVWPAVGPISGVYGSQRILNGKPKWPHYGVDIAVPTGTDIIAPAGGIITLAHPDMFYSGGTIILDHGHGLSSAFLHLSELLVKQGDVVRQGDIIARSGATGRATGAHLDWRMNWFKRRIDPQLLVPPMAEILADRPDNLSSNQTHY